MVFPITQPVQDARDIPQREHSLPAVAKRVTLVDPVGGDIDVLNPLPVTPVAVTPGLSLSFYGASGAVVYGAETTLITYTVPAGKIFKINSVNVGGEADGEFNIYINSSKVAVIRNSAADRTKEVYFGDLQANAGNVIDLKVKNITYNKHTALYEATLGGIRT